jgi:phosphomevalonate kinase
VLAGAPALVAAIDRWATVRIEPGGDDGTLVVESLAEGSMWRAGDPDRDALPAGDAGAVLSALRSVATDGRLSRARVVVDSRPFLLGEQKLGLGRSAATVTAAVAALLAAAGERDRGRVLAAALGANALLQEGLGSGADVAAAVHGGLIEVRRREGPPAVVERRLPAGLVLVAGWTGTPAPTAPLLRRFATARRPAALEPLGAAAEAAAAAVARGDADGLLDSVRRTTDLLDDLGAELGVPIVTPALRCLVAAAARAGVAAKPSGAGGGDCGIAFARSLVEAAAVVAAWRAEGILPLAVQVAGEGASVG